jgi:hypothetical protein
MKAGARIALGLEAGGKPTMGPEAGKGSPGPGKPLSTLPEEGNAPAHYTRMDGSCSTSYGV